MKVSENGVLRANEVTGGCMMGSCMTYTIYQILLGW